MHLSDHDLRQLDEAALARLTPEQARALLSKVVADLKAARERLGQNPRNSSRPPSSQARWAQALEAEEVPEASAPSAAEGTPEALAAAESAGAVKRTRPQGRGSGQPTGRPGRRPGAAGHSRTVQLPVDAEEVHAPHGCAICGCAFDESHERRAHNAHGVLELVPPAHGGRGLVVQHTKHIYLERRCPCGHWTQARPGRVGADDDWTVALSEWHLAGPTLVAFICALTQRMRLSRAKVREFLSDWLGLPLSTALIDQCVHEAGRAVEPVAEQEVLVAVRNVELLHADETSWKEHGQLLWLWVFTCATATLFIVGRRTRAMVQRVLGEGFSHWLMSDGYCAYRDLDQRLRCLPHIIRKARGLEEGFDAPARALGRHVLEVITTVMQAVYDARGAPPQSGLRAAHAPLLNALLAHCQRLAECPHEKTRALARELLNDWDTFWVVLDHPELPLSNNEAERALRHWVIARRMGMGTRTPQGTRAFALIASVIETCRKRNASPWPYLAEVIRQRRKGLPAPPLPIPSP